MASHPSRLAATCSPPFSSSFRNISTDQEELSGAYYIRSLMKKHLSSSSSSPARSQEEDHHLNTMTNNTIPHDQQPQLQQEQSPVVLKPQMKKQARRRTHASRPYQKRLLNMAEARREIVTALKIHRATMRQQPCTYQHHQEPLLLRQPPIQQEHQQQQGQVVFQDRSQAAVEEEAPLMAPTSYAASFADHQLCNPLGQWVAAATPAGSYYYPSSVRPYDLTPLEAPTAMGGLDQLARSLPAQPLGLNLSFQGFCGSVDGAKDCEDLFGVPSIRSSPPAASSYSAYSPPATETASGTHGSPALSTAEKYPPSVVDAPAAFVAPVLDDMETQPAGEMQQGVEWWGEATAADMAAASAWWSKILLESMEVGGGEVAEGGAAGCAADDVATAAAAAGLPAEWRWLCEVGVGAQGAVTGADGKTPNVLETTHADGDYSTCCYEGVRRSDGGGDGIAALPCMDGVEGWDGEWFSCSS